MAGIGSGRPPESTAIHGSVRSRGRWHGRGGGREGYGCPRERTEPFKFDVICMVLGDLHGYLHGYCMYLDDLQVFLHNLNDLHACLQIFM